MRMATRKSEILNKFRLFSGNTGGIEGWLNENTDDYIIDRIVRMDQEPLSRAHLNQLFLLAHEGGLSEGFFNFYWLFVPAPGAHPYDVTNLPQFAPSWTNEKAIVSIDHFFLGFLSTICRRAFVLWKRSTSIQDIPYTEPH